LISNIIFGFIVPWIFGTWLFSKNKKLVFVIFPFSSIISYTVNSFGFHIDFWKVQPIDLGTLSMLPFNLGLYGLFGCFLIYIIQKTQVNKYVIIFTFSLITTIIELIGVMIGKVAYSNGWNIFYTYFSYLISYAFVYWYYLLSKKFKIL